MNERFIVFDRSVIDGEMGLSRRSAVLACSGGHPIEQRPRVGPSAAGERARIDPPGGNLQARTRHHVEAGGERSSSRTTEASAQLLRQQLPRTIGNNPMSHLIECLSRSFVDRETLTFCFVLDRVIPKLSRQQ